MEYRRDPPTTSLMRAIYQRNVAERGEGREGARREEPGRLRLFGERPWPARKRITYPLYVRQCYAYTPPYRSERIFIRTIGEEEDFRVISGNFAVARSRRYRRAANPESRARNPAPFPSENAVRLQEKTDTTREGNDDARRRGRIRKNR